MYPSYEDARTLCEQSMTRPFRTLTPRECEQTAVEFHAQREALKRELARMQEQRDMMAGVIDRLRAENASLLADMDALTRP